MNHKQPKTLHALFVHPVSSNIDPRLAFSTLEALGAEVTHGGRGHIVARLIGQTRGFHDAHQALSKDEVVTLRKFLEAAGIDPAHDFPLDAIAA